MQINLRQREIETALKMYLHSQGINLKEKSITIDFTAGRKDSGLSAEISIVDYEDNQGVMDRRHAPQQSTETSPAPLTSTVSEDPTEPPPMEAAPAGVKPVSLFN